MGNSLRKKSREQEERAGGKIFKAAVTSPLRTNRRVSRRKRSAYSATRIRRNRETVQVKLDGTSALTAKPMSKMEPSGGKEKKMVKADEMFNDYIKRAKLKIRATTNVGDDASETETDVPVVSVPKDSGRDQFAEYIEKAKMKLRATSSIGNGNSNPNSFKHANNVD